MKNKSITVTTLGSLAFVLITCAGLVGAPLTITGDGACARCQLKDGNACQAVVTAVEDGRNVTYYLRENAVTRELGKQLCAEHKQLKVTGTVQTVEGKFELTPIKIEIVKPPI